MAPSLFTTTSLGLLSSLPSWWLASTVIVPSGSVRVRWLEACSQAISRPCWSQARPFDLLQGLRKVVTPSFWLQRRRWSPGMSLKSRYFSRRCQSGPSVKMKPVASRSNSTELPTTLSNRLSRISTPLMTWPPLGPPSSAAR